MLRTRLTMINAKIIYRIQEGIDDFMRLFFAIMLLLLAVVPAQILFQKFNKVPLAFFQIGIGLVLSILPLYRNFSIDPDVFLLVIISTLMFSDSRRLNLGTFALSLRTTLSLSVSLVIVSVILVGGLAHLITPQLSLFGGFMLAAILSPTDAVAYQSITAKTPLPGYLDSMLQNESLLNDASGLVAFNLALNTINTGTFSPVSAVTNFVYVFIGGIVVGLLLGWLFMVSRRWMIIHNMDVNMVIVPYILATPYIIYFVAEELNVSGILAVVAAGLLRTWEQTNWQLSTSKIQDATYATEDIISSILNGLVFIIMGISLPTIIKLIGAANINLLNVVIIGFILYLALFVIRLIWFASGIVTIITPMHPNRLINSLLTATNGIHGTVTLMLALSIPLTIPGFSTGLRATIILIVVIVILLSMIVPVFLTPLLLNVYPQEPDQQTEAETVWNELIEDSLNRISKLKISNELTSYLATLIVTQRQMQPIHQRKLVSLFHATSKFEKKASLKLIADNELTEIVSKYHNQVIKREVMNQQITPWTALVYWWEVLKSGQSPKQMLATSGSPLGTFQQQRIKLEKVCYPQIMQYLRTQNLDGRLPEANTLARIYVTRHDEILNTETINKERFYMLSLFSSEIEYVREQYWNNRLSLVESRKLIYDISLQQAIYVRRDFD